MFSPVGLRCPTCQALMHRSRARSWLERLRRRVTRRVPVRCSACGWRGWRLVEREERSTGLREIHQALTDAELERLEPTIPKETDRDG
jgi:hypothetical protein